MEDLTQRQQGQNEIPMKSQISMSKTEVENKQQFETITAILLKHIVLDTFYIYLD